jgi:hypothetical protein
MQQLRCSVKCSKAQALLQDSVIRHSSVSAMSAQSASFCCTAIEQHFPADIYFLVATRDNELAETLDEVIERGTMLALFRTK